MCLHAPASVLCTKLSSNLRYHICLCSSQQEWLHPPTSFLGQWLHDRGWRVITDSALVASRLRTYGNKWFSAMSYWTVLLQNHHTMGMPSHALGQQSLRSGLVCLAQETSIGLPSVNVRSASCMRPPRKTSRQIDMFRKYSNRANLSSGDTKLHSFPFPSYLLYQKRVVAAIVVRSLARCYLFEHRSLDFIGTRA